jgi:hypothetical protein
MSACQLGPQLRRRHGGDARCVPGWSAVGDRDGRQPDCGLTFRVRLWMCRRPASCRFSRSRAASGVAQDGLTVAAAAHAKRHLSHPPAQPPRRAMTGHRGCVKTARRPRLRARRPGPDDPVYRGRQMAGMPQIVPPGGGQLLTTQVGLPATRCSRRETTGPRSRRSRPSPAAGGSWAKTTRTPSPPRPAARADDEVLTEPPAQGRRASRRAAG